MKSAHEKLTQASHKLAEALYKASSTQGAAPGSPSDGSTAGPTAGEAKKEGEVIDAEYVDVDDKK
jgi:molecular chaperone DnaK